MFGRQRLWIGTALVVVLALIPASLVGGSGQTTQVSMDADNAQRVALAPDAAPIEAGMSAMSLETLSALAVQSDDCDDPDHGKKIKCKSEKLVAEACNGAALAAQDDLGLFSQSTKDELDNLCAYGTAAVAAADPAEFKSAGLRRDARGIVMAYTGPDRSDSSQEPCEDPSDQDCYLGKGYKSDDDGDGICSLKGKSDATALAEEQGAGPDAHGKQPNQLYSEWCAEALGDGIGDEDGFCEIQGKGKTKFLEPCLEVTGVGALDEQEENFNSDKLIAFENALDAQTGTLRARNAAMVQGMEELRAQRALSTELLAGGDPGQCLQMAHTEYGDRPEFWHLEGALLGGITLEGLYNQCDSAMNEDVLGFNGSIACVVLATAKSVANLAGEPFELLDDSISGARLDNAVMCLEYLGENLDDITNGVNEANAMIDHVVEHRRAHLQVVELKEKSEFLVSATEAGRPSQPGHEIVASFTVRVSEKQPLSFVDVTASTTWTPQGNGLYLVVVDLPQSLKNAELFVFEVGHTETYTVEVIEEVNGTKQTVTKTESVEHSGSTLFDRSAQNNVGMGQ